MNATLKQALAAAALLGAFAAPASAIGTDELRRELQSTLSEGHVNVVVDDGLATLTGETDTVSKRAAERAALASDEVDRVVNLINSM